MILLIDPRGSAHAIYSETIDLASLGTLSIRRASHVEPDAEGRWHADLGPCGGPRLGPFAKRSEALAAEVDWLETAMFRMTTFSEEFHDPNRRDDVASSPECVETNGLSHSSKPITGLCGGG
jgi:hypothetical protein